MVGTFVRHKRQIFVGLQVLQASYAKLCWEKVPDLFTIVNLSLEFKFPKELWLQDLFYCLTGWKAFDSLEEQIDT